MVGTGRFELPTPRTPSQGSTRLSHVPTRKESEDSSPISDEPCSGVHSGFYTRGGFSSPPGNGTGLFLGAFRSTGRGRLSLFKDCKLNFLLHWIDPVHQYPDLLPQF